jgi:hypothetical protein
MTLLVQRGELRSGLGSGAGGSTRLPPRGLLAVRPRLHAQGCGLVAASRVRYTAVALWIAVGANPKEVSTRAGHASVSFTLDRYGHLYPEADMALRDRLDALYVAGAEAEPGMVIELPRDRSRPQRGPQQDERRR